MSLNENDISIIGEVIGKSLIELYDLIETYLFGEEVNDKKINTVRLFNF